MRLDDNMRISMRSKIIAGAKKYNDYLMNKLFMVVCEDGSVHEVRFFASDFQHLTGLLSDLSETEFFQRCYDATLSVNNILEEQRYNLSTLKYKHKIISDIEKIIYGDSSQSLFMMNLHTKTSDYPVAIRNKSLKACVCFRQDIHRARSLRKYSNSENADNQLEIIGIFAKPIGSSKYTELVYFKNTELFLSFELDMTVFSDDVIAKIS